MKKIASNSEFFQVRCHTCGSIGNDGHGLVMRVENRWCHVDGPTSSVEIKCHRCKLLEDMAESCRLPKSIIKSVYQAQR